MLDGLTTAHLADGCLRAGVAPRCAALRPVIAGRRVHGKALPVQHFGSVDIFLEALEHASPGSILVIDNSARLDEACAGDLVSLEAQQAGIGALVIWGAHRDTEEIRQIGMPVFSLGAMPVGPRRLDTRTADALEKANVAGFVVNADDYVVADDDGVLFMPQARLDEIVAEAAQVRDTERTQAAQAKEGRSLRRQFHFAEYLEKRKSDPNLTLRKHLEEKKAAIEVRFS